MRYSLIQFYQNHQAGKNQSDFCVNISLKDQRTDRKRKATVTKVVCASLCMTDF